MLDKKKTTLTEWYVYNNQNTDGRHLTYLDFPSESVWSPKTKSWHRRVIRTKKSIGRLTYVHPNSGDLFYFRMLLCHKKGCKSPAEVQTINRQVLPTYLATCEALGLLGDDKEWDLALEESAVSASSVELRMLFAYILIYCDVADPPKLWAKHWYAMQDDIPTKVSEATGIPKYQVNTPELQQYILYELEKILSKFGKSIKDFGLPLPPRRMLEDLKNKLLMEERNYKRDLLSQDVAQFVPKLNRDQKEISSLIINASEEIASLGITSLLLPVGRTAHFSFKLPLDLTEESIFHAKKHSQLANLLITTDLIIWDEAPMNDKRCFEALDRTPRDLMSAPEILFGGKTVILGGDFRQTLPVKKRHAKEELIHASIMESYLWPHFKVCTLKENMRLLRSDLSDEERKWSEVFAKWILNVGDGGIGDYDQQNDEETYWITIPHEYCTLQEKAIVCPKNHTVDEVKAKILSSVKGVMKTYLSRDEAIPVGKEISETELLYLIEYLNTITFPGFPPHELQLKAGTPIMML
ncbi:DNA helicase [Tanacetum coccineum]